MQFGLSEEQILLQDNVKRFLNDNASLDHVRKYAEGESDANIWAGLSELGVAALLIPEEHGGIGMTATGRSYSCRMLGQQCCTWTLSRQRRDGTYRVDRQWRRSWRIAG